MIEARRHDAALRIRAVIQLLPYLKAMIAWTSPSEAETHRLTAGQVAVDPFPDLTG